MEIAKRQGLERGWLTYTELSNLMPSLAIAKAFLQHTTIFAVSYAASVVTIAGAFFLASKVPGTALYSSLSKTETMKLNDHIIVNDTTHSSPLLDNSNGIVDGCCDFDDVLFERLKIDLLENTTVSEKPSVVNQSTVVAPGLGHIPKLNLVPNSYVGFQSGVNLRSFLDDNGQKWNDSDYLTNLNHVPDESLCRNFGNLVTWMKLI